VLTVALADPDGTLAALQSRVSAGLEAAGVYTPEKRPFRAHITVARLRPRARPAPAPQLALDDAPFAAPSLTLYRSQLHPKGARYTAVAGTMLAA
jgi:2'-5' RNA ligase